MPTPRIRGVAVLAVTAAIALSACGGSGASNDARASASSSDAAPSGSVGYLLPPSSSISLQGAGATFPAPLYGTWFEQYSAQHANVKIDYQANGSGAGIKAITQQTVDFGASDAAMTDEEVAALAAGTKILHVPTALGAVVLIYDLPGADGLQLDGQNVADIFLGNVTSWNDPKIATNNPGLNLPNTPIQVVHRSDGSGTTNAFTSYLAAVSSDWKSRVGAGKDVKWPVGIGAKGNDGVAGGVRQTPGSVGYVELNYATQAQLPSAKLKNAAGNFVAGSVDGVIAAASSAAAGFPADFRQAPIINGAGAQTYPIASYTYILVYADQKDAEKGKALVSFLGWALTDGQSLEKDLGYAPLPTEVQAKGVAELHTITSGGAAIWP